jgi:hypothetical protein
MSLAMPETGYDTSLQAAVDAALIPPCESWLQCDHEAAWPSLSDQCPVDVWVCDVHKTRWENICEHSPGQLFRCMHCGQTHRIAPLRFVPIR